MTLRFLGLCGVSLGRLDGVTANQPGSPLFDGQEGPLCLGELVLHLLYHSACVHPAFIGSLSRSHDTESQQSFLTGLVQRHEHARSALLFQST